LHQFSHHLLALLFALQILWQQLVDQESLLSQFVATLL